MIGLNQVQRAINNISGLGVTFNGGTNLFTDSALVTQYANQLRGLTLQQAELALSTKMLTNEQKQQILAEMGLIATENTIQAELLQTTLAQSGLNTEKQKAILIQLGLMKEQTGEILTQNACTKAELENILALHGVTGAQAENIISTLGLSGANQIATISFGLLTKSIWANIKAMTVWLASNPMGWTIITAGAIAGAIGIINAFTVSLDESKENLSNLKDECADIESSLDSMNNELQTTVEKLNELENKDSLTFAEKEEYDNLKATNDELQRKIDLLELEQKMRNKEKNKSFVQTMETSANTNVSIMGTPTNIPLKEYVQTQLSDYIRLVEDGISEDEKERAAYLENYLREINTEWSEIADGIDYIKNPSSEDDKAVNEWLDYINDFQDKMAIAMGGTNAKTNAFNRVINNWKFDSVIKELKVLGKEGKVTAEMLDDPKYDSFIQKLVEIGVIDSADNLESVALAFNGVSGALENNANVTNNTIPSVESLTDAFAALKEALEDIIGYADTYQSAMQKISAGTGLTTDEVLKLLEIDPSLFDKFIKQKDGTWTIPIEFLIDSHDSVVVNNGKVKDTIKQYQSEYDNAVKALEQYTAERNNLVVNDAVTRAAASDLDKKIAETEKKIESAQKNINLASFYESVLDYSDADRIRDSYDEVVKKIDEYNDGISSLNKAIDTINEGNSLSYDEMTQLIELYPELEGKVIETANGYTIEVNALKDVRTQSYKTRNDYIDDRTAEVAALREDVKQQIEEYKRLAIARIVSENSHGNYIATTDELLENDPEYQALLLKLELYDEYFNKVVGYKRTVTGNDNSSSSDKSVSNSLQNQIDYYKILLEAIGIVSDKVVEGLEKEKDAIDQKIDALNDEKDALQEKNDEQQRELDLIEAKNNLDKAKKQKVFVYKEGQGLVQVQDEKAVADAQKEYDDIQKEIEIANIDKQIDVYEKQKEAIDDQIDAQQKYSEQFTNMESDIKDTLTVEQAKKALGTDEKGLLSLDDKTFNVIRDGLATATYNKDVNDNKENSKYVTVKLEDYLKSVGATVTPTEFKAMASTITNNPANIVPATNANSTINNAQTINNKTANFNATFNIYDALDPHKIIDTVKEYFNGVLKQTINSVK